MTAKLSVICSKQSNGAYFAVCPELKGCFTQGDTYEEASANIRELAEAIINADICLPLYGNNRNEREDEY